MKSSVFWDIMPCNPLEVNGHFGGTCHLHLQSWRVRQAGFCLLPASCWFLAWITLQPWRRKRHVRPKRRSTFNVLHGVISQKTELFILTKVRRCSTRYMATWHTVNFHNIMDYLWHIANCPKHNALFIEPRRKPVKIHISCTTSLLGQTISVHGCSYSLQTFKFTGCGLASFQ
jgi:hypothetical protein